MTNLSFLLGFLLEAPLLFLYVERFVVGGEIRVTILGHTNYEKSATNLFVICYLLLINVNKLIASQCKI